MKLTRQEQKLHDFLAQCDGFVTAKQIAAALWGDSYAHSDERVHISVLLCRLRKAGVPIEHGGRNLGWRIAPKDAA